MKKAAAILLFGFMLIPFGAEAQTKPATNLDQANQMIVLLQKQLLVLQEQLSELREGNKNATKAIYYASLSTEWDTKQAKNCFAITIAEKDDTAAAYRDFSIVVVDKSTAVASFRKGKTFKLKTDDFGKATYCGNATKITIKKSNLLKQDKSFSTEGMLEEIEATKSASCKQKYQSEIASLNTLYEAKIGGLYESVSDSPAWRKINGTDAKRAALEKEKNAALQVATRNLESCGSR